MKKQLVSLLYIIAFTVSVFGMDVPDGTSRSRSSTSSTALAAAAAMTSTTNSLASRSSSISSSAAPQEKLTIILGRDIDIEVAKESTTIKHMIEDIGGETLYLSCTQSGFDLVKHLMQLQHTHATSPEVIREEPATAKKLLQEKIKTTLERKTTDELMQIVLVANYLDVQPALEVVTEMLAEKLVNMNNLDANLACPTFAAVNAHCDITKLIRNYFWKKIGAFRFLIEQDRKLNQSYRTSRTLFNDIDTFSWSPDGSKIIGIGGSGCVFRASEDGAARIWDVTTGSCLQKFVDQKGWICSVCWSPDSNRAATGSKGRVKIWDVLSGNCLQTLSDHTDKEIYSICWSPDGTKIASGSRHGTVKIWCITSGDCLQISPDSEDWISAICWSSDGSKFATGSGQKGAVKIWDAQSGACLKTLSDYCEWGIHSISWSSDNSSIVSGSGSGAIKIWDAITGACLQTILYRNPIYSVCWSPDSTKIAFGLRNGEVKICDASSGNCLQKLDGRSDWFIKSVCWSPDGHNIAYGSVDKRVTIRVVNNSLIDYLQNSLTLEKALFLIHAHDCIQKGSSFSTKRLTVFCGLPKDLQLTLLKTLYPSCEYTKPIAQTDVD